MLSRWEGKTWGTLGDSITEAGGYQRHVRRALGFRDVFNFGKSGCPMTAGGERDYGATTNVGRAISPVPDCITIFAGVNDFRLDKPLGNEYSYDIFTFFGAYRSLIEDILTKSPECRLNLWTPLQRDKDGFDTQYVNGAGNRLIHYVEAVHEIGQEYALPVLDLYRESGFNRLTLPIFTDDGLHPNEAGYLRIADMAISFLSRL